MGSRQAQQGAIFIGASMMVLMIAVLVFAAVTFTATEAKALNEDGDRMVAFYRAEAALQAARYEIGENLDADADGLGSVSTGDWNVTATLIDVKRRLHAYQVFPSHRTWDIREYLGGRRTLWGNFDTPHTLAISGADRTIRRCPARPTQ